MVVSVRSSVECASFLPIVVRTADVLKKSKFDMRGWRRTGYSGTFEIAVSPASEERALLILDRVLRTCQEAGLEFVSKVNDRGPAYFELVGTRLTLRVFEAAKRSERAMTSEEFAVRSANPGGYVYMRDRYIYAPTGKLRLEMRLLRQRQPELSIVDNVSKRLVDQIVDVPAKLMAIAVSHQVSGDRGSQLDRPSAAGFSYVPAERGSCCVAGS